MDDFEFVGLDTASNRIHAVHQRTRLAEKRFEVLDIWEFHASKDIPDVRRGELYRSAREFFAALEIRSPGCHVFCEEPIAGKNGKTTRLLCLATGAIWVAHLDFDLMWHWVDIAHWKKQICGSGAARKPEIQEWSLEHGGQEEWEEDHHDANGIGVSGALDLAALDVPDGDC